MKGNAQKLPGPWVARATLHLTNLWARWVFGFFASPGFPTSISPAKLLLRKVALSMRELGCAPR